ncbi:hypothetical protein CN984_17730 [Bacillus cereus]|uniref:DUF4177 domain-containing protein n=1 Tax=Bacillus cereus TaxID=1396 RepID=A0A2B9PVG4_BACCE|nr:DUF4177 domain-containing protein [Bacillus cereus]PGO26409.1 hypothetical protein CN984_17730 [Bacillus cereus]
MQWEYKTLKIDGTLKSLFGAKGLDLEGEFNKLGIDGWELVSIIGLGSGGSIQNCLQAIFKRPIK